MNNTYDTTSSPAYFIARSREREFFLKHLEKTNVFFLSGVAGIGKTSFILDIVPSFENLGYTFWYTRVSPHATIGMFLSEVLETLYPTPYEKDPHLSPLEDALESIKDYLITKKIILCIDDFHHIEHERSEYIIRAFQGACVRSTKKSKLVVLSRKQAIGLDDVAFLDSFRLEFDGLSKGESLKFIKGFFELHNYTKANETAIEKIAHVLEYNPYLIKIALNLLVQKNFPLTDFLEKKFLNQEEFIQFLYSNYLAFYDEKTIEFLHLLSCFRTIIDVENLRAVYTCGSFSEILHTLKADLLIQEFGWGKIKLKSMIQDYCSVHLSEDKKKVYYAICLDYLKKIEPKCQTIEVLSEIFHCYIMLGKTNEAEALLLENYRKLIDGGNHENVVAMIDELKKHKKNLSIVLQLAKIEIGHFIMGTESTLEGIESIEKTLNGIQCLDLLLLKISILHRELYLDKNALDLIEIMLMLLQDKTENSSAVMHYHDRELLYIKTVCERISINLSPYEHNAEQIKRDIHDIESRLENIKDGREYSVLRATIYNFKAKQSSDRGDNEATIDGIQKALTIAEQLNNRYLIARLCYHAALYLLFSLENSESALGYLQRSTTLAEQNNYPYLLHWSYILYGRYNLELGNFEEALTYFKKADRVTSSYRPSIPIVYNKLFIVITLNFLEKYNEATQLLQDIEATYSEIISSSSALVICTTREWLFLAMHYDDQDKALKCSEVILRNIKNQQDKAARVSFFNLLTHYYIYTKDYKKALECIHSVQNEKMGETSQAEVNYWLYRVYFGEKHYEIALNYINEAVTYYEKKKMYYRLCFSYIFKARVHYTMANYDEARKALFASLEISEAKHYEYWNAVGKGLLASIYMHIAKYELSYATIAEILPKALEKSYYDVLATSYQLLMYFFQYPLSEKVKKWIQKELKMDSLDKLEGLYEHYYKETSSRQKEFVSIIKEPTFEKHRYYFHVVTHEKTEYLNTAEYTDFIKHSSHRYELFVDMEEGVIVSKSKTKLELTKHDLLFRLLVYLIRHRGQIKHKEDLILSLWHERYDPFVHDQVLYVAINKLRKNIEDTGEGQQFQFIRNVELGYYFNDKSSFCFIEKKIMLPDSALTYRQEWVLQFLVDNQKITNKDVALYFKTSRTTAYKDLDELVVKKILKKKGKGRSTYYCI